MASGGMPKRGRRFGWLFVAALAAFVVFWFLALTDRLPLPKRQPHEQAAETKAPETAPESAQDITAEIVAYYTEVLAWFTGGLVIVGFLQVFLLFRTDKTARKGIEIAERQMKISGA